MSYQSVSLDRRWAVQLRKMHARPSKNFGISQWDLVSKGTHPAQSNILKSSAEGATGMRRKQADEMPIQGDPQQMEQQPPQQEAPPQQEGQPQGGGIQQIPELLPLSAYPGDVALRAKSFIDKMPDETLKEMMLRLYLHELMANPQIEGNPQAAMQAIEQHLMEAAPPKGAQKRASGSPATTGHFDVIQGTAISGSAEALGRALGAFVFRSMR